MRCSKYRRATEVLPSLSGCVDATPLSLTEELPLILRQARHHRQHEPASRGRSINPEVQDSQVYLALSEVVSQEEHFWGSAHETTHFRDHQGVAGNKTGDKRVQSWPIYDPRRLLDDDLGNP